MDLNRHITGCILGTAVGDAIGLPREGLSRSRAQRMFGGPPLRHALIGRRGMCSDDTEHTLMVAQALIASGGDPGQFARVLAHRIRWWLVRLPAGVGFATLRAGCKLWMGFGPAQSGVASAGNGPAMRSALLGIAARDRDHLDELVRASTRITHTDPRALEGAAIVAHATYLIAHNPTATECSGALAEMLAYVAKESQLRTSMNAIVPALNDSLSAAAFADRLGLASGVSGFVNHTVPVAIYCWLRNRGSFRDAVESAVVLGGDTDTVGAIVGAIAGTEAGADGIPRDWLDGLMEWPASVAWMRRVADQLAENLCKGHSQAPLACSPMSLLLRNGFFLAVVLAHGLRRILPPY